VLYDAGQYPLARALCSRHDRAELWYVRAGSPAPEADDRRRAAPEADDRRREQLAAFDERARERATAVVPAVRGKEARVEGRALRERLIELEVISARPFLPRGARIVAR
jgi:hypothetical protein